MGEEEEEREEEDGEEEEEGGVKVKARGGACDLIIYCSCVQEGRPFTVPCRMDCSTGRGRTDVKPVWRGGGSGGKGGGRLGLSCTNLYTL